MMTKNPGDSIDDLLRSLPPAPAGWTHSLEELPLLQRAPALLDERCPRADLPELTEQVDAALREVGLEPDEQRLAMLRRLRRLRGQR